MGETHTKMAYFCQFAEFYRLRNEYSGTTLKNSCLKNKNPQGSKNRGCAVNINCDTASVSERKSTASEVSVRFTLVKGSEVELLFIVFQILKFDIALKKESLLSCRQLCYQWI